VGREIVIGAKSLPQLNRPRPARALVTSVAAVAAVSLAVAALDSVAPVLSLGALYLLAVLPVAALYGTAWGLGVSVASMVVFNWFFLPPTHTLRLASSENWVALAVYLFTAVVVSELATRLRRQAAESEQRRAEAAFAAEISRLLLERPSVEAELREIASRAAALLGAARGRIELGSHRRPDPGWSAYDLDAGSRHVGRLFLEGGRTPEDVAARVPPMLASVLASALDREQLARQARDAESRLAREEAEAEALRRSDAAKTAVLRSVSHDLRSPLTAIGTLGELLESAELSEPERRELVAEIRAQTHRLDRLVSNLLDLSRLEAGAARPAQELWPADGLVSRALDALGDNADRVTVSLPETPALVRVDAAQLERALVNLLENAVRYSPEGEPVELVVGLEGGEVVIRIRDHGPGIPASRRGRIFQAFQSGEDERRGSGLGLAIARGFVQLNGGRLWVEPRRGGAELALSLPAAATPAEVAT
jgi:two-component system, OmpR family, sensor histidine kinase KdpD